MLDETFILTNSMRTIVESLRILLVDDNLKFRTSALRYLNSCIKYELLTWASSGEEALKKVEQFNPTLILMDISLPGINGLQATQTIRGMNNNVKILMLTLGDNPEYRKKAIDAGADDFISKSDFGMEIESKIKQIFI